MDRLAGLRVPLATASLVALSVVVLARIGLGLSELGPDGSVAVAAARFAPNGSDGALTVLAGALVASCSVAPVVGARRRFAVWGAVLCTVSLLATVVALALTDLVVAGWAVVWTVPDLVVPAIVGVALVAFARTPGAVPRAVAAAAPPDERVPEEPVPEEPAPDPALQPTWNGDEATGAVWRTAGEAASGAPALGWDPSGGGPWPLPTPTTPPSRPALPSGPEAPDGGRRNDLDASGPR